MIGDRMKQARLSAGLTLEETAKKLGAMAQPITKAGLSKYETNKSVPGPAFLLKVARALDVKASYFLREPTVVLDWLTFPAHAPDQKARLEQLKASAAERVEGQLWLQSILSPGTRPRFPGTQSVRTGEEAETVAALVRKTWRIGDGPIESLTWAIEDGGGVVVVLPGKRDEFHCLRGWATRTARAPVLVLNQALSYHERHYFLAYALGHLFLQCEGVSRKEQEHLAHRFAVALLVPPEAARRELGPRRRCQTYAELAHVNRKYGLRGVRDWVQRACQVGILDQRRARSLYRQFAKKDERQNNFASIGGRPPTFEFAGAEEPTRLEQLTLRALAEGIITEEKAEQLRPSIVALAEELEGPSLAEPGPSSAHEAAARSADDVMKLPKEEREQLLASAAADAAEEYRTKPDLMDFEAFGEEDLYVNGDEAPKQPETVGGLAREV